MESLKEKLEKVLEEHQRESGLHVIGGRTQLLERLLQVLDRPFHATGSSDHIPSDESGRCCQ